MNILEINKEQKTYMADLPTRTLREEISATDQKAAWGNTPAAEVTISKEGLEAWKETAEKRLFLELFKTMNSPKGIAVGVMSNLMNKYTDFWAKTWELWH